MSFLFFQYYWLILLPYSYIATLVLSYTLIGIVADWVIVPRYHNLVSSIMGALFMGGVTYMIPVIYHVGSVPLISAFLLAIFLGVIEATLHSLIVKPFLEKL